MAIIFSKNSGLNDDFWKVEAQVLESVMKDVDSEKNDYDKLVSDIFMEKKSKKYAEKATGITTFGNFQKVSEGGKAPLDDIQETFPKLIVHTAFMKGFVCTREMKDDGDIDIMKTSAQNMVRSYKRSRAQFASDALTAEGTTFTYEGGVYDRTTGDGKALFAQDHPGKKAGVPTQSNIFTNAFGDDAMMLTRLANIGKNFKSDSGHVQGYTFDTIIIPSNVPKLQDLISRIIRSDRLVGSNYNDVNTQKGLWNLIIDPLWQVADDSEPYIIMSSQAQKELEGNVFYNRVPLDVTNWVDNDTRNLCWNGYARFSAGFRNWRHVIMGGAKSGTTLS